MMRAGMDGIRLNASHAGLAACAPWLEALLSAARAEGREISLLIDLMGPELRLGRLSRPVMLKPGEELALARTEAQGLPLPEPLLGALEPGMRFTLDDGALELLALSGGRARVIRGGRLDGLKSVSLPGVTLPLPALTQSDLENLRLAPQWGVSGAMLPFVRGPEDLHELERAAIAAGCPGLERFAKVEDALGVERLLDYAGYAHEVVIARGDLGANLPVYQLPGVQKRISHQMRALGKRFMVVTQMLSSMMVSETPTRAEVMDIAQAVFDGASSVMLTGETAAGAHPVEAVAAMRGAVDGALAYLAAGGPL